MTGKPEARIIGPESELGDIGEGLTFFGHTLTREFSEHDFTPDEIATLQDNRYVELRGVPPKATPEELKEQHQAAEKNASKAAEAAEAKTAEKAEKAEAKTAAPTRA